MLLTHILTVAIPFGNIPLMLSKGIVYCHTEHSGRVNTILLKSHKTETVFEGKSLIGNGNLTSFR